jgi:hypothetical protein
MKNKQYIIFTATMFIVSITSTRLIDFVGGRQYFFWYLRMFLFILVAGCYGYAFELKKKALSVAVLAVLVGTMSLFVYSQNELIRPIDTDTSFSMSQKETDGLLWAYNNIDHSARMITNGAYALRLQHGIWVPFGPQDYLALSGLYGYAWLSEWMPPDVAPVVSARNAEESRFWQASTTEERERRLAALPVDYMFVRKREDPSLDYTGLAGVRRIYSNEDLDIYALRNAAPQN